MDSKQSRNPKVVQLENEIELSRLKLQGEDLKEMIFRYHKKFYPQGSCLYFYLAEILACRALDLIRFDETLPLDNVIGGQGISIDEKSTMDTFIKECVEMISKAKQAVDHPLYQMKHQQCLILQSFCELFLNGVDAAMGILSQVQLASLIDEGSGGSATSVIQYYCIKTWILYTLDSKSTLVTDTIQQGLDFVQSQQSLSQYPFSSQWTEFCVYTFVSINAQSMEEDKALKIKKASLFYLEGFPHTPETGSSNLRKITILYYYLSTLILELNQPQPLCGVQHLSKVLSNTKFSVEKEGLMKQIRIWLPKYERLVISVMPFPSGIENSKLTGRAMRIQKAFDWWVNIEMFPGRYADDGIGDVIDRHYHLLEILYRGTKHTFLSLRLLRYICQTFFSLVSISRDSLCLDEKKEGRLVVATYVNHWEKKFTLLLDARIKEKREQAANTVKIESPYQSHRLSGQISQIPGSSALLYEKERESYANSNLQNRRNTVSNSNDKNQESLVGDNLKNNHVSEKVLTKAQNTVPEDAVFEAPETPLKTNLDGDTVIIQEVEGETVEDVVGVLITGVRMILKQHEGNVSMVFYS
jgi:hypothetical protein